MAGAFQLVGGAALPIRQKLTGATLTADVAGNANNRTSIVTFQITEIAAGTPDLTIAVYDASTTTTYYLRNALAMTAKEEVTKGEGIILEKNEFLRITIGSGSVDIVGMALLIP